MLKAHASGLLLYRIQNTIEYLMLQTSYGSHHWTPPKGHLDPGEDEQKAAIRETKEESGITEDQYVIDKSFRKLIQYKVNGTDKVVMYILAQLMDLKAEVKLSEEHQAYRWCYYEEALQYAEFKELKHVIETAQEYILQKLQDEMP